MFTFWACLATRIETFGSLAEIKVSSSVGNDVTEYSRTVHDVPEIINYFFPRDMTDLMLWTIIIIKETGIIAKIGRLTSFLKFLRKSYG
jgi:hypothetical protein